MKTVLPADIENQIRHHRETGRFETDIDVIRAAMNLLDKQDQTEWLLEALVAGEDGDGIPVTPDLLEKLGREAEMNANARKPIRSAVKA